MNIVNFQSPIVVAKTCGCMESGKKKVTYAFQEEFHKLCIDKKDVIHAEIEACEKLLRYLSDESERAVVQKETSELRTMLDLLT